MKDSGMKGSGENRRFPCRNCDAVSAPWPGALCITCYKEERRASGERFVCPNCGKNRALWRRALCESCYNKAHRDVFSHIGMMVLTGAVIVTVLSAAAVAMLAFTEPEGVPDAEEIVS